MSSAGTSELLTMMLPVLPLVLVWLCGLLYAVVSWRRHPSVSGMVCAGCGLLLLNLVGGQLLVWLVLQQQAAMGLPASQLSLSLGTIALLRSVLSAVGVALLLVAAFGWRGGPQRLPGEMDLGPRRLDVASTGI